jgi:8-amino-7-oxononanoate synthase
MHERRESELRQRIGSDLESLRKRSQLRVLDTPSGIDFCSNDYLGLANDPRLKLALLESVARGGKVGGTGSRLLSGNARVWEDLEMEFAGFAGSEAALYFGSGYAANVGLLSSILGPGDTAFSDALNHASLIDGIRLSRAHKFIYPHCDMDALERGLRDRQGAPGARVIVTESVFSMEGDIAPLGRLIRLANDYEAELVIDEAHATGVWGPEGRGIVAEHGYERQVLAIVHTCGKALASAGGFVCSDLALKRYLLNRARTFIYSTALPPYLSGQIHAALGLARKANLERTALVAAAQVLRASMVATGMNCGSSTTQIVPVWLGSSEAALQVAARLGASGFAVRAIRPPTVPNGQARLRLSLTSGIALEDIRRLVRITVETVRSLSEPPAVTGAHAR